MLHSNEMISQSFMVSIMPAVAEPHLNAPPTFDDLRALARLGAAPSAARSRGGDFSFVSFCPLHRLSAEGFPFSFFLPFLPIVVPRGPPRPSDRAPSIGGGYGGMEVGAIEPDRIPIEGAIEPRSKGDGSRSKGDRTLQIYRDAWLIIRAPGRFGSKLDFELSTRCGDNERGRQLRRPISRTKVLPRMRL
jgi:hypothetical protein